MQPHILFALCLIFFGFGQAQDFTVTANTSPCTQCDPPNGQVSFSIEDGGIPPFQYYVNSNLISGSVLTNLAAGTYGFTVIDKSKSSANGAFTIGGPPPSPTVSVNAINVSCSGLSDGKINFFNAAGGSPPYKYSVDGTNFLPDSPIPNLGSGNYNAKIKDSLGCVSGTIAVTIYQPAALEASCLVLSSPSCATAGGTMRISASGGTPPYEFSVDGNLYSSTNTDYPVSSGPFTCYVRDNHLCKSQGNNVMPPGPVVNVTASIQEVTNCSFPNGRITITPNGGRGPYQFLLPGATDWTLSASFVTVQNLSAGEFAYSVRDEANCAFEYSSIIPIASGLFKVSFDVRPSCENSGSITINAMCGTPPYKYSINNGSTFSTNGTFSNLTAGSYIVVVKDSANVFFSPSRALNVAPTCCGAGYTPLPNGTCTDVDECATNNGGCDEIVHCQNTPGNRTCSDCPPGYTGSGYSFCNTTCGDGVCNGPENCINCFRDCKSPSCQICGDGYCDPSIKEDCTTCFDDCGACDKKCPENCNGHGTCANGVCICTGTWTDPACGTASGNPFNVTTPPTQPTINLTSSDQKFSISIKSIGEVDQNNQLIRSFFVSNMSFSYSTSTSGNNTLQNYTTTIEKDVTMNVIIQQFENPTTTFTFANTTLNFPPHTLKLTIQVQKWRFFSLANSLVIVMDSVGDNSQNCVGTSEDANVNYVLLVSGNVTLYGQFMDKAELDDRVRSVKYSSGNDGITITVPHFWDYADLDPNFNVLLGAPDKYQSFCEKKTSQKKGLGVSKKIIAIVIPVVFFCAVLAIVIILLLPRIKTWRKVKKAEKVNSVDMDPTDVEKRGDMETHTSAGKFNVRF